MLKELEEIADQVHRMKMAFAKLTNVTELALALDSGHGWLNAADMSDNAFWHEEKPRVFGNRHALSNEARDRAWGTCFERAQVNSFDIMSGSLRTTNWQRKYLKELSPKPWESFLSARYQPFLRLRRGTIQPWLLPNTASMLQEELLGALWGPYRDLEIINKQLRMLQGITMDDSSGHAQSAVLHQLTHGVPNLGCRFPVFPLIFSGVNISADVGGGNSVLNARVSAPEGYPLRPNGLTTPQIEWLRETSWAQQAFVSAYTCAVIDNMGTFQHVQALNLATIPSGMLMNFHRSDFFDALPNLTALTILVIPDWQETGVTSRDEGPISPVGPEQAAETFTKFLEERILPLHGLKELTIGYIGGGERATGMFARNQHVLPAPIIRLPRPSVWNADKEGVLTFRTIKKITFKNCWFSPAMLKTFLKNSAATLEDLTLDSCSLTARPGCGRVRAYRKFELVPQFDAAQFYLEELRKGTWARILNRFTPGITLEEQHVLSAPDELLTAPSRPESALRRLELVSCGYVILSDPDFNQKRLPIPDFRSMDSGLHARFSKFRDVMMLHGEYCRLLGTIVQCVGQDEQHVLERGFGMVFGWGKDIERWACLEDGFFEGGTGRFSGVLENDGTERYDFHEESDDSDGRESPLTSHMHH